MSPPWVTGLSQGPEESSQLNTAAPPDRFPVCLGNTALEVPEDRLGVKKTTDSRGQDRHLQAAPLLRTRSEANGGPQGLRICISVLASPE